jgi:glycosyltransferase involved in cell wall biosynthesis
MVEWSFLARVMAKSGRYSPCYDNFHVRGMISGWKPDIMHETYYQFKGITSDTIPTVVTVHDMIHELYPGMFAKDNPTHLQKQRSIERADHVICISENTRSDLIRILKVPSAKISVVYHGFDPPASRDAASEAGGSGYPKPYLLYVGHRAGHKNFAALVRAFALSPGISKDYDLVAFGGGPFSPEELNLIADVRLPEGSVRQLGGDDPTLAAHYRGAVAFIYPSIYEGFGLPPLEAMAQGCPVISSNTSSMPEVIGNAAEFFDPLDVESMADSLRKVLYDPSYAADLVQRGHRRLKDFSWQRCARETLDVYRTLVR